MTLEQLISNENDEYLQLAIQEATADILSNGIGFGVKLTELEEKDFILKVEEYYKIYKGNMK